MKLHNTLWLPVVIILGLCVSAQAAASATEKLQAQVPDGWIKGIEKTLANLTISEYFPPDTGTTWTQKLSYEVMSGTGLPDPIEYAHGISEQQAEYCKEFTANTVFAGFENGYPTMVHLLNWKRASKAWSTFLK